VLSDSQLVARLVPVLVGVLDVGSAVASVDELVVL